jgi:Rrf2 family nitric oxide-sensitive transcriptional repressor
MTAYIKREYDYAIRICAYLASFNKKEHKSVPEISKKLYLTIPFTTKIVHQLKNNNIIETVQGKYGGIKLKVSPAKLSFFDILNAMGLDMTINECLRNPQICTLIDNCKTHRFFLSQEYEIIENLKNATINNFILTDDDRSQLNNE